MFPVHGYAPWCQELLQCEWRRAGTEYDTCQSQTTLPRRREADCDKCDGSSGGFVCADTHPRRLHSFFSPHARHGGPQRPYAPRQPLLLRPAPRQVAPYVVTSRLALLRGGVCVRACVRVRTTIYYSTSSTATPQTRTMMPAGGLAMSYRCGNKAGGCGN